MKTTKWVTRFVLVIALWLGAVQAAMGQQEALYELINEAEK